MSHRRMPKTSRWDCLKPEGSSENNETETGITIHYVSNQYDSGEIIFQKKISIEENDTVTSIEEKIHILEYEYYPKVIQSILIK